MVGLVCTERHRWPPVRKSPPRPETTVGESEVRAPGSKRLRSESVQGASLPLERVHHVEGGDGLAAGVLRVGHSITDDVLQEHLEDTAGPLVDEARDTLDSSTTSQTPDGGLGDSWMLSRNTFLWRLAPPFPRPLPPFPRPDMIYMSLLGKDQLKLNCERQRGRRERKMRGLAWREADFAGSATFLNARASVRRTER